MLDSIQLILQQIQATSNWEWIAFLFGIAQVVLATHNKSINFYAGLISVSIYIVLFFQAGLFAESALNFYYFMVSLVGIFYWKKKSSSESFITKTTPNEWWITLAITLGATLLIAYVLMAFTPSTVPFLDAFVSASAWAGTWLLLRRKLENWIVLNISNAMAIPLQIYKGMPLTSILTFIFFVIAIKGYFDWKKKIQLI